MERPWCSIPNAAEAAPVRDPLLHPRPRRLSDRGGANHGPRGGLVAPRVADEDARRGVRVIVAITGEILRAHGASTHWSTTRDFRRGQSRMVHPHAVCAES